MERKWLSVLVSFTEQYNTLKTSPISVRTLLRNKSSTATAKIKAINGNIQKKRAYTLLIHAV